MYTQEGAYYEQSKSYSYDWFVSTYNDAGLFQGEQQKRRSIWRILS